jgi:hypothetical protein
MRESARQALKIGKNPVAALVPKLAQSPIEKDVIIHDAFAPSVNYFTYLCMHPRRLTNIRAEITGRHLDPDQEIRPVVPLD